MRVVPLRTRVAVLAVILALNGVVAAAARLHPEAIAAWSVYVSAAETRIRRELESPRGFLVMDFLQDAADERRNVLAGGVVIQKMETVDSQGRRMTVNSALVHHLRGDVLIPGVTVRRAADRTADTRPQAGRCAPLHHPRTRTGSHAHLPQAAASANSSPWSTTRSTR